MKAATNIAIIAALSALAITVSGFAGVVLFFFLMYLAMDFYALPESEKKNDDQLPEAGNMVEQHPRVAETHSDKKPLRGLPRDGINQASTGSPTVGITTGKGYVRNDEQAAAGDYTNPNAPSDTVQIGNVDAPAKPGKAFELEITD